MSLRYIKLFYEFADEVEGLTFEECGRLVMAMLQYARTGEVAGETLVGNERLLFPLYRLQIDRMGAAYEQRCRQNAINGRKGGRPPLNARDAEPAAGTEAGPNNRMGFFGCEKSQAKAKAKAEAKAEAKAKAEAEEQENDNIAESEGEGTRVRAREPAPTLREVTDFCREENLRVDSRTFWNHYQSVGWRAGDRPIRDWRAKLREWDARDGQGDGPRNHASPEKANPALDYQQRSWCDDDFGDDFFVDLDRYGDADVSWGRFS